MEEFQQNCLKLNSFLLLVETSVFPLKVKVLVSRI